MRHDSEKTFVAITRGVSWNLSEPVLVRQVGPDLSPALIAALRDAMRDALMDRGIVPLEDGGGE